MTTTNKDIIITPFRGVAANNPIIQFATGDASANYSMNVVYYTTSNGTLSFEGSAGQLFSVTNDLTGSIYSVNDVSGIPSIDVNANGTISLAPYGGTIGLGPVPIAVTSQKATISKGFSVNTYNIGAVTQGSTITPDPNNGNYQYYYNYGDHTIQSPITDCAIDLLMVAPPSYNVVTTVGSPTTSINSTTITLPSGMQGNDYVFLFAANNIGGTSPTTPTGYTSIYTNTTSPFSGRIAYKKMPATPDTTATVQNLSSGGGWLAIAFRGVTDNTGPLDIALVSTTGTSTAPDSPVLTTNTDNSLVLSIAMIENNVSSAVPTVSAYPTGYTSIASATFAGTSNATGIFVSSKTLSPAATENPGAFTIPVSYPWKGITFAIRPSLAPVGQRSGNITFSGFSTTSYGANGVPFDPTTAYNSNTYWNMSIRRINQISTYVVNGPWNS